MKLIITAPNSGVKGTPKEMRTPNSPTESVPIAQMDRVPDCDSEFSVLEACSFQKIITSYPVENQLRIYGSNNLQFFLDGMDAEDRKNDYAVCM